MDDGARDAREGAGMLRMLAGQGVTAVAATPHYYSADETIESFLIRRGRALRELERETGRASVPRLLPGAEAAFFAGMAGEERIGDLRIEGTCAILIEMPPGAWTTAAVNEVYQLSATRGLTPLMAHVERHGCLGRNAGALGDIISFGGLAQANASFFLSLRTRRQALGMLRRGRVHVFGSDCHNLAARPPDMGALGRLLRRKLRPEELRGIEERESRLLGGGPG
jgi:protein-tyrosine phosphatase